jgi:hypothetical protein
MVRRFVAPALGVMMLGSLPAEAGQDYRSQVKLTVQSPFMCAARHFHIPGTAENQSSVTLGRVRIKCCRSSSGEKMKYTGLDYVGRGDARWRNQWM